MTAILRNYRIVGYIALTLLLAVLVGLGLMFGSPGILVAFGAWCGGVTFTLGVQEFTYVMETGR